MPISLRNPQFCRKSHLGLVKPQGRLYQTNHSKKKARKERREKQQNSRLYKRQGLLYVIYCIWWAKEHVCPSQTTLGKLVDVNRDTCREYLRDLVRLGWLPKWTFRWFDTCIYNVLFTMPTGNLETRRQVAYRFRGIKRPKGFKVPPWLFGMIMANLPKEQAYALLKYGITHKSFLRKGYRNKKYTENKRKKDRKLWKSKFGDPNPHLTKLLITKYNLNLQKAEFLARNEERVLLLAMEDLDTYVSKFRKTVKNYFGFLLNRCKEHALGIAKEISANKTKVRKNIEKAVSNIIEAANADLPKFYGYVGKKPFIKSLDDIIKLVRPDRQKGYNLVAKYQDSAEKIKESQRQYISFFEKGGKWKGQKPPVFVETPQDRIDWLKGYLTSIQKKVAFLGSEKQVKRGIVAENTKPGVLLQIHKQDPAKSKLKIFQKVRGAWIDREFTFDHPDFKKAVMEYFKAMFKTISLWA